MIDLREFYKDYYDKTLERKNEINSSLSVLVGIIAALIAALFYMLINFDFHFNILLSVVFIIFSAVGAFFLGCSVYYVTQLLIHAGKINTANNDNKDIHRYKCHKAVIYAIVVLSLVLIVFYVNFVFNK